jgi:hypothetical protein
MREMSRRQLLTGVGGIAAGTAIGQAAGTTALASPATGRRAAATAARRAARRAGQAPGAVLWRAQAGTATPSTFLGIAAGYGMVYAYNVPSPPKRASLACAFDADTGTRAWQRPSLQPQPQAVGPGAVFWSTITLTAGPCMPAAPVTT